MNVEVKERPINPWARVIEALGENGEAQFAKVAEAVTYIKNKVPEGTIVRHGYRVYSGKNQIDNLPHIRFDEKHAVELGFKISTTLGVLARLESQDNLRLYIDVLQGAVAGYMPVVTGAPAPNTSVDKFEQDVGKVKKAIEKELPETPLETFLICLWALTTQKNTPNIKAFSIDRVTSVLLEVDPETFPTPGRVEDVMYEGMDPREGLLQQRKLGVGSASVGIGLSKKGRSFVRRRFLDM